MGSRIAKAEPLYIQAYDQLKSDIIEGKLKPGARLTDQQLAEWLGISRTPVREATRILCREGLLLSDHGTVSVYQPTMEDICQVYLMRASAESLAASIIAVKKNKNIIIGAMEKIVDKSSIALDNNDFKTVQRLNREFHKYIINNCGLDNLQEIYEPLDAKMKIFRSVTLKKARNSQISIGEHKELLMLLKQGDVIGSKKLAERHILAAGKRALEEFGIDGNVNNDLIKEIQKYIDMHLTEIK